MNEEFINSVVETDSFSIEAIKSKLADNDRIFVVELDGANLQSWHDYISIVEDAFKFPRSCEENWNRYLDWIRDLTWFDRDGFILIIRNFSSFMKDAPEIRNAIITEFSDCILPFWQEEVKKVFVGGESKSFMVYLVD